MADVLAGCRSPVLEKAGRDGSGPLISWAHGTDAEALPVSVCLPDPDDLFDISDGLFAFSKSATCAGSRSALPPLHVHLKPHSARKEMFGRGVFGAVKLFADPATPALIAVKSFGRHVGLRSHAPEASSGLLAASVRQGRHWRRSGWFLRQALPRFHNTENAFFVSRRGCRDEFHSIAGL
jgi:hypothetical protein